jgi:hypothetical protein
MQLRDLNKLIIFLAMILCLAMTAWAAENLQTKKPGLNAGERGNILPIAKVTIEKKTLGALITNVGDRYAVTDATIIADGKGNQVSIRQMLVPCEVEMTFVTEGGVRKADYVKILQVGRDASWQWISDKPD